jgi:hypothetical protein
VHAAFVFREDFSGVYLVLTQGIAEPRRQLGGAVARATLRQRAADLRPFAAALAERGFRLDDLIDLRTADPALGRDAEAAVVAHKLYEAGAVPGDDALAADVEALLHAYDRYLRARRGRAIAPAVPRAREPRARYAAAPWEAERAALAVVKHVGARGFVFEPWQVAAYLTALRTKPFVILAGVSGIGKSRLPALVEEATGGQARLVPVRPDWTDSAEALGYTDLAGVFRPGQVLRVGARSRGPPGPPLHLRAGRDEPRPPGALLRRGAEPHRGPPPAPGRRLRRRAAGGRRAGRVARRGPPPNLALVGR